MKYSFLTILAAYFAMTVQGEITPENMHEYFETTEDLVEAVNKYKAGNMEAGEMFDLFKSFEDHADDVGEYTDEDDGGDRRMLREDPPEDEREGPGVIIITRCSASWAVDQCMKARLRGQHPITHNSELATHDANSVSAPPD